jgi:histidinol-phosphate/aromatic aminotransferase/cobyric acid decarboxylase-like protein
MSQYQKPPELYDGLRLHQNENTGGCSPKVLAALAALRPDQVGFYPPYAQATEAVARYLETPTDRIALTNGLDEGIMALAVAYLRP